MSINQFHHSERAVKVGCWRVVINQLTNFIENYLSGQTGTELYVCETLPVPLRQYFLLVLLFIVNNNIQQVYAKLICLMPSGFKL